MSHDLVTELDTTKPDPEWLKLLEKRGFLFGQPIVACCDRCASQCALKQKLKEILSSVGYALIMPHLENDIHPLIERGFFIDPDDVISKKGEPSRCHANAAALWSANRKHLSIMTGYGLSRQGGIWRQHTWCLLTHDPQTDEELEEKVIVETTEPRILYYGFILSYEEAEKFEWNNYF